MLKDTDFILYKRCLLDFYLPVQVGDVNGFMTFMTQLGYTREYLTLKLWGNLRIWGRSEDVIEDGKGLGIENPCSQSNLSS